MMKIYREGGGIYGNYRDFFNMKIFDEAVLEEAKGFGRDSVIRRISTLNHLKR